MANKDKHKPKVVPETGDRQREIGWWLAAVLCVFALFSAYHDTFDQYILTLAVIVSKPAGALLAAFLFRRESRPAD